MYKKIFKRIFDLFLLIVSLPIVLVLSVLVSVIIIIFDKGPILYTSQRLGKNKEVFKMYKFRTMKVNAADIRNEDGSTFNSDKDNRVTHIGKMLRKTSLDEIPQILNIFIGNMSFVGPRPDLYNQSSFYENCGVVVDKFNVLPGITGLAQVSGRNNISWRKKLVLDNEYVEKIGFWLDVKVLILTFFKVLFSKNINKVTNDASIEQ